MWFDFVCFFFLWWLCRRRFVCLWLLVFFSCGGFEVLSSLTRNSVVLILSLSFWKCFTFSSNIMFLSILLSGNNRFSFSYLGRIMTSFRKFSLSVCVLYLMFFWRKDSPNSLLSFCLWLSLRRRLLWRRHNDSSEPSRQCLTPSQTLSRATHWFPDAHEYFPAVSQIKTSSYFEDI